MVLYERTVGDVPLDARRVQVEVRCGGWSARPEIHELGHSSGRRVEVQPWLRGVHVAPPLSGDMRGRLERHDHRLRTKPGAVSRRKNVPQSVSAVTVLASADFALRDIE